MDSPSTISVDTYSFKIEGFRVHASKSPAKNAIDVVRSRHVEGVRGGTGSEQGEGLRHILVKDFIKSSAPPLTWRGAMSGPHARLRSRSIPHRFFSDPFPLDTKSVGFRGRSPRCL